VLNALPPSNLAAAGWLRAAVLRPPDPELAEAQAVSTGRGEKHRCRLATGGGSERQELVLEGSGDRGREGEELSECTLV
jgi:hypothetical protein